MQVLFAAQAQVQGGSTATERIEGIRTALHFRCCEAAKQADNCTNIHAAKTHQNGLRAFFSPGDIRPSERRRSPRQASKSHCEIKLSTTHPQASTYPHIVHRLSTKVDGKGGAPDNAYSAIECHESIGLVNEGKDDEQDQFRGLPTDVGSGRR